MHERFRRDTSATIRALSANPELEASFAANSKGRIGNDVYLPMPTKGMPSEDKARSEGRPTRLA